MKLFNKLFFTLLLFLTTIIVNSQEAISHVNDVITEINNIDINKVF